MAGGSSQGLATMTLKGWVQASVGEGSLENPDCIPGRAVQGKCCYACGFPGPSLSAGMVEEQVATPSQQPHLRGSGLRDPLLLASCGTEMAELAMKSNRIDIKPLTTYTLSALTLHQPVPTEGQWGKTRVEEETLAVSEHRRAASPCRAVQ